MLRGIALVKQAPQRAMMSVSRFSVDRETFKRRWRSTYEKFVSGNLENPALRE